MVRFGFALAGCAVLVTVHAGLTMAQESPTGVLNAVAFKPLPAGAPILVRPFNDTDENLAIKKEYRGGPEGAGLHHWHGSQRNCSEFRKPQPTGLLDQYAPTEVCRIAGLRR